MRDSEKEAIKITVGLGCLSLALFVFVVFTIAAALKWVIS